MTGRRAPAGLAGAALTGIAYRVLLRRPPGGPERWQRWNFRGAPVTLLAGPAVAGGAVAAAALAAPPLAAAVTCAGGAAALAGAYDDLVGAREHERTTKGFAGHLGALRQGRVSAGAVKIGVIGAGSLAAGLLTRAPGGGIVDVAVRGGLVAGTANLVNLLDLRPGRAAKAALVTATPLVAAGGPSAPVAAAAVGAALAVLPEDLGERAMLGDAGANALGALVGLAAAVRLPAPGRVAALAVVAGLTAASEKVSFSAVIDRTPLLRALDRLGRT